MRQSLFCLLVLLGVPVFGQSWDALKGLKPGVIVRVEEKDRTTTSGELKKVSDDSIRYVSAAGEVEIERAKVKRVEVRSPERRLRNTLIGAAIGAGIAVAVDQTLGQYLRNESGDESRAIRSLAVVGGMAGLGALVAPYKTVYRAR